METDADILLEVSWEVCNKVGGIYTVVSSKATLLKDAYRQYYLIGPYIPQQARQEFTEKAAPPELAKIFLALKKEGIVAHYGIWQIKGEPEVILLESKGLLPQKNDWKKFYWDTHKVDSLTAQWDFEEPLLWATAAGKFVEKFCAGKDGKKRMVLHAHEWLAGFAILYCKAQKVQVGTVFTTHATMVGRSICGNDRNLYELLAALNPDEEAKRYGISDKHSCERACAAAADVFTTVSEITAIEAEKILGRKPEVLVLNGLDIEKFPTFEETSIKHRLNRDLIRSFIAYYFFPHYYFDLEQTLTLFIVGRYEFKNKGIDIFIKALGKLNERMREEDHRKTVVAFFWIPRDVHGAKSELSMNKASYLQIQDYLSRNIKQIQQRLMHWVLRCDADTLLEGEHSITEHLFDTEALQGLRRLRMNFTKPGNPLIVTHNLPGEEQDIIIRNLLAEGLDNKDDDKVKVIFYPVYLTGIDGLIDLPYYEAIMGCHLGVFPSYYEPWGYTPLESAALGVPALTTDFGGFGRFLMANKVAEKGVFVLHRMGKPEAEVVEEFTEVLYNFAALNEKGRVQQKIAAKELAGLADWRELIKNYFQAHNLAVERVWGKK